MKRRDLIRRARSVETLAWNLCGDTAIWARGPLLGIEMKKDLPTRGLRVGDVGTIVEKYGTKGIEVEFVTGAGRTQALVTLGVDDVREFGASDLLGVRPLDLERVHKIELTAA